MTTIKNIGIWMDHSSAHIMECTSAPIEIKTINLKFSRQKKEQSFVKDKGQSDKNEQHQRLEYFRKIGKRIMKHNEVVLFGPTDAKFQLANILRTDDRFAKIRIEIRQTNKPTEFQQHLFVKDFFTRQ